MGNIHGNLGAIPGLEHIFTKKIYQNLDPSISLDGVNGYFSPACFDFQVEIMLL